ncbi:helix-turn-helix domain-containing protein [Rhizobium binxianense]
MNIYKNARLTPHSRAVIAHRVVIEGQRPTVVAAAFGVCVKTVYKWVRRYRREGEAGLHDRGCRPHRLFRPTPQETAARIAALRRLRMTGRQIAKETGVSPAAVSYVLKRPRPEQAQRPFPDLYIRSIASLSALLIMVSAPVRGHRQSRRH